MKRIWQFIRRLFAMPRDADGNLLAWMSNRDVVKFMYAHLCDDNNGLLSIQIQDCGSWRKPEYLRLVWRGQEVAVLNLLGGGRRGTLIWRDVPAETRSEMFKQMRGLMS